MHTRSKFPWVSRACRTLIAAALAAGCTTNDPSFDGGSGGSGNVPSTCDQSCQDYLVGFGLTDAIWFLWGSLIAGHSEGAQDTMGSCPLGGSAHVTGTTGVADTINTADLAFDFQSCASSEAVYELTFTGSVAMDGSFDSATDFAAMTFDASSLEASGALHYYDDPVIDDTCETRVAQEGGGEAFTISGQRCGRTFDESSLGGNGAGGSGGSGQGGAGGSGGDCACFCPDGSDCTNATGSNPCGVDSNGIPEPCGCPVGC